MNKDFFSQNLKYLLDTGKISAKTILQITGNNSPGLITMWKNGERQITTKDLVTIANHLNYTVDDLINKDLTKQEERKDEFEILFDKNKDILTDEDKEYMRFIIEKRKKEIDKQLGE